MKHTLAIVLASLMIFPSFASVSAQQKPAAALGRVATLGEISEVQKKIIANRLEGILSKSYDLISQEQYLKAEEAAFAALDLEKCTAEQCIRKIQEFLQVERLFVLQILREADFTQLTLNLVKLDSKRVVEGVCEKCSISQLYGRIDELAKELVAQDIKERVREMIAAQPTAEPPPQIEPPQPLQKEEGGFPWWGWVLAILGGVGLAAALSSDDAASSNPDPCPTTQCGSIPVSY